MKKLKLCAVVLTELQHWTLFITKYILKIKSLRINQNHSFIKVKKVRKFKWSSIRLCYVISYSILLALFLQNFFDQTGKYCNCSLLAKQLKTTARLPTKFCSDLARFFRENTRSKSTKSIKKISIE